MEACVSQRLRVMHTWFKTSRTTDRWPTPRQARSVYQEGTPWDPTINGELDARVAPQQWAEVVKDVRSNTEYGMSSDNRPLEVTLQVRLAARRPDKAAPRSGLTSEVSVTNIKRAWMPGWFRRRQPWRRRTRWTRRWGCWPKRLRWP